MRRPQSSGMPADAHCVDVMYIRMHSLRFSQRESRAMEHQPQPGPASGAGKIVDAAPLLLALRAVRGLSAPVELEADGQAEALAILARLAKGEPGVLRQRAAAALWRLGIAPRPVAACAQPGDVVGECVAARVSCARCEFNPARLMPQADAGR